MAVTAVEPGLLRLLAWTSPAMPTGGFTHSHGLEAAIEAGLVRSAAELGSYVEMALRHGAGWNDAVLCAAAHRSVSDEDDRALDELLAIGAALRGTAELGLESTAQGRALLRTLRAAWPAPALDRLFGRSRATGVAPALPLVFGIATAAHGIGRTAALQAFLHGFVAAIVSAGVRLIPLGQTDGQRLTARTESAVAEVACAAATASLDDLGSAAPLIDLCSMAHEVQHTRLFRS